MRVIICPKCSKPMTLVEIADGIYKCNSCGYTGYAQGKSIKKK